MKKFKKKFIFIPILLFIIAICFTFSSVKPLKAAEDRKYFVNFKDLYVSLQELGEEPSHYIGTNYIRYDQDLSISPVWFEYDGFSFNNIELVVNGDFSFSIRFINGFTGLIVPLIENNLIVSSIPYISISNDLFLSELYSPNPTYQLNTEDLFLTLFSREENTYSFRGGIYDIRMESIFINFDVDGFRYNNIITEDVYYYYTYIVYSPQSMSLTFKDGTIFNFNYLLIGNYDAQTFAFFKEDITNYRELYWFTPDNPQVEYGLPEYEGIDYFYFPPNSKITRLVYSDVNTAYTSTYVFDNSFAYGFTTDVVDFTDFFTSIINVPILYMQSIMSFEVFGFNLFYTFSALITALLCVWIVRKLL